MNLEVMTTEVDRILVILIAAYFKGIKPWSTEECVRAARNIIEESEK